MTTNDFKSQWIAALRSGEWEQAIDTWFSDGEEGPKHCCLDVAQCLKRGVGKSERGSDEIPFQQATDLFVTDFGLSLYEATDIREHLVCMNDHYGCTFDQIANFIEDL